MPRWVAVLAYCSISSRLTPGNSLPALIEQRHTKPSNDLRARRSHYGPTPSESSTCGLNMLMPLAPMSPSDRVQNWEPQLRLSKKGTPS